MDVWLIWLPFLVWFSLFSLLNTNIFMHILSGGYPFFPALRNSRRRDHCCSHVSLACPLWSQVLFFPSLILESWINITHLQPVRLVWRWSLALLKHQCICLLVTDHCCQVRRPVIGMPISSSKNLFTWVLTTVNLSWKEKGDTHLPEQRGV